MTQSVVIDLIRHGEPVGGRRYRGQIDDPLSEKGWTQMRAAVGDHAPWQHIITSPLLRCREFALELAKRHQIRVHEEPRFKEIGFGAWEGKTADELRAADPDIIQRFIRDPQRHRPAGAESLEAFRERVVAAWTDVVQRTEFQQVLIVAHAGVIRMVLRHILDMPLDKLFRIQVGNAAITRIKVDKSQIEPWPQLIWHDGHL